MPIISIQGRRILFIHVPKTGGTAIARHFARHGDVFFEKVSDKKKLRLRCEPSHFHGAPLTDLFPMDFFNFIFVVVRDPVDRVVSDYRYYVRRKKLDPKPRHFSRWLRYRLWRASHNPYFMDNHFRPQHEFEVPGVRVFRYEDGLEACTAEIIAANGLAMPADLARENVSPSIPVAPGKADLDLIRRVYREDFERYGYSR